MQRPDKILENGDYNRKAEPKKYVSAQRHPRDLAKALFPSRDFH